MPASGKPSPRQAPQDAALGSLHRAQIFPTLSAIQCRHLGLLKNDRQRPSEGEVRFVTARALALAPKPCSQVCTHGSWLQQPCRYAGVFFGWTHPVRCTRAGFAHLTILLRNGSDGSEAESRFVFFSSLRLLREASIPSLSCVLEPR